jgi:RNA polymerase sigma-70 factor (ECF subfamily)
MDERALVRRLLAGDENAFDEFFAEYFPRLFRFACARVSGSEEVAEEAVQATLIRALQRIAKFRGEAALFTWLCAICRHEIARVQHNDAAAAVGDPIDDSPGIRAALDALALAAAADVESQARREELARLVQATLDHLPARYGEALEWKYIDGLSVDEVAARLGLGYKAAESLLSRARQAFRDGFHALLPEGS